jgi:hypothetical protein
MARRSKWYRELPQDGFEESLESAPPRSGLTIAQAGTSESRTEDPQASRGKAVESKK